MITGHSRGAAVANLTAKTLTDELGKTDVFAYTFATPNCTTIPMNRNNIFNFCFTDDFVPQVPLSGWGYGKYGFTSDTTSALTLAAANPIGDNPFRTEMLAYVSRSRGN